VLSYPSGMTMSTRALQLLADTLRRHRRERGTRWRKLTPGRQALLVLAHLRKGETYSDLACGFKVGTSTVYRYLREAIGLLAALAPSLDQASRSRVGRRSSSSTAPCCASTESAWPAGMTGRSTRANTSATA
jgi:hypothetical protein